MHLQQQHSAFAVRTPCHLGTQTVAHSPQGGVRSGWASYCVLAATTARSLCMHAHTQCSRSSMRDNISNKQSTTRPTPSQCLHYTLDLIATACMRTLSDASHTHCPLMRKAQRSTQLQQAHSVSIQHSPTHTPISHTPQHVAVDMKEECCSTKGGGGGAAVVHSSPRCRCRGIVQLKSGEGPSKSAGNIGPGVCTALVVQHLVLACGGCLEQKAIPGGSTVGNGAGAAWVNVDSQRLRLLDGVEGASSKGLIGSV